MFSGKTERVAMSRVLGDAGLGKRMMAELSAYLECDAASEINVCLVVSLSANKRHESFRFKESSSVAMFMKIATAN
ncbi:hypothetical protein [uncultured Vagococcus sp.]|uniref:hypothetical protein n=1 Tax=uncultured Vagococcus sp. TaxID=189676 RepID=UPI0028D303EF|nr:hypothetical protein [uncultured Vagococcus sp.]